VNLALYRIGCRLQLHGPKLRHDIRSLGLLVTLGYAEDTAKSILIHTDGRQDG